MLFRSKHAPAFHIQQNQEKLSIRITDPNQTIQAEMLKILLNDSAESHDARWVSLYIIRRAVLRLHGVISSAENNQGVRQITIEIPNVR